VGRLDRNAAREVNINSTIFENALLPEALKLYRAVTLVHLRRVVKDKVPEPNFFAEGWGLQTWLAMLHAGISRLLVNIAVRAQRGSSLACFSFAPLAVNSSLPLLTLNSNPL
jgi:hypothetical protein